MKVGDFIKGVALFVAVALHMNTLNSWDPDLGPFLTLLYFVSIFLLGAIVVWTVKYYLEHQEIFTLLETKLFQQMIVGYGGLSILLFAVS